MTPTGTFIVTSAVGWDLSQLYTTGEVTLTSAAGLILSDFNGDSLVDAADLASWKAGFGTSDNAARMQGNSDCDQGVDGADFLAWQRQLGSSAPAVSANAPVPEPTTSMLVIVTAVGIRLMGSRVRQELVSA